jgi:hypothetical protein
MPSRIMAAHFTPLNQLLQWLQCLSSEETLGGLIATLQNLQSLNPMQLLRAARDYRYEVDESRLGEECAQYLSMMQKDWESQRMRNARDADGAAEGSSESTEGSPDPGAETKLRGTNDAARQFDDVFSSASTLLEYEPPSPPETLGELLDSRYMVSETMTIASSEGCRKLTLVCLDSFRSHFLWRPIAFCKLTRPTSLDPSLVGIVVIRLPLCDTYSTLPKAR